MRAVVFAISFLTLCGVQGAAMAQRDSANLSAARAEPYRAIMRDTVEKLNAMGVNVAPPDHLPALTPCDACLRDHEAFGAYVAEDDFVYVPVGFDVTTLEGRSTLAHEYGHYLLNKAGQPQNDQESICLALGNAVVRDYLVAMQTGTEAKEP